MCRRRGKTYHNQYRTTMTKPRFLWDLQELRGDSNPDPSPGPVKLFQTIYFIHKKFIVLFNCHKEKIFTTHLPSPNWGW